MCCKNLLLYSAVALSMVKQAKCHIPKSNVGFCISHSSQTCLATLLKQVSSTQTTQTEVGQKKGASITACHKTSLLHKWVAQWDKFKSLAVPAGLTLGWVARGSSFSWPCRQQAKWPCTTHWPFLDAFSLLFSQPFSPFLLLYQWDQKKSECLYIDVTNQNTIFTFSSYSGDF